MAKREYGMGNLSVVAFGENVTMAAYVAGRVTNKGVTTKQVNDKTVANASISVRNAGQYEVNRVLKHFNIPEGAIVVNKDDQENEYIYMDIDVWGVPGNNFAKVVKGGDSVRLHGILRDDKYTGKDGKEHHSLKMTVTKWEKVFYKKDTTTDRTAEVAEAPVEEKTETVVIEPVVEDIDFDDLPF